jgi:hypothetical protein
VKDAAIFSNYLSFKKCLDQIKPGKKVVFNFSEAHVVDHTLLEHLHHFEEDYHHTGGHVLMHGMGKHRAHSDHPLATRKFSSADLSRMEFKLNKRQMELRDFAEDHEFTFYPTKYKGFPIEKGARIQYEENLLSKYTEKCKIEVSDITLTEGARMAQDDTHITVLHLSDLRGSIPDLALEPEALWTKFSELSFGRDIDFPEHPGFSKKYYLRGDNESAIRNFFNADLIQFLDTHEGLHIESHRNKILIYARRNELVPQEIETVLHFGIELLNVIDKYEHHHA